MKDLFLTILNGHLFDVKASKFEQDALFQVTTFVWYLYLIRWEDRKSVV